MEKELGTVKEKKNEEEERDRRRQIEANANRSVVESLRLRGTDAKLIKNTQISMSRGTIRSERYPMALVFSVRQQESQGKKRHNNNNNNNKKVM